MTPLDDVDIRILDLLQADASLSIAEIGDKVHLSQNACWRRIKRLEDDGIIRQRVALVDARKIGVGITVFVTLRTGQHTEQWLEEFAAAVRRIPEVVEFYRMAGEVDYLLKLRIDTIATYDSVYKKLIQAGHLTDVSAAFAMEELKHTTAVPLAAATDRSRTRTSAGLGG